MIIPSIPLNEAARLAALGQMDLMGTPTEEPFDSLVELAAHILEAPVAYMSFLGPDVQWFKARFGMTMTQTPREVSLCGHAILEERPMVVEDTLLDERFKDNPYVQGAPHVRFYAGAQIRTYEGLCVGTLCVLDIQPRHSTKEQIHYLELLARLATQLVETRRRESTLATDWPFAKTGRF